MNDLLTTTLSVAAIKFKWQKEGDPKLYDYFVPAGMTLAPGDKVMVETKRGETEVEVVEIKDTSDKAEKPIMRRAEPKADQPVAAASSEDWSF